MTQLPQNIGFVGAGNMASAIIGGLLSAGYDSARLCAIDPSEAAQTKLHNLGISEVGGQPGPTFRTSELVILAVKPQFMQAATEGIKKHLAPETVVMSVAAGISVSALKDQLSNSNAPVVRCMPNTPALVGAGASGLFASPEVTDRQRTGIDAVMGVVGTTVWLEKESHIDVVTAISGSGPAYFFAFMEAMIATGERMGLDHETASQLTLQTALGAAKLATQQSDPVNELRRNVTSPGGTTERALESFDQDNLEALVNRGMQACLARAQEMAKEFG
ncbi:MAG: pyrroline-5-carboxylate reductase [Luminiphilus sp.]|nr:pyrroline-5-carboxylate reductase [Luminiphilus sp.]MDG2136403.1 pyrroline-5-carboxylate reductase [Luminiphilus sp.]